MGRFKLHDAIILEDVLYVPQFRFILISVYKLCLTDSIKVFFTNQTCFTQGHLMCKPILLGKESQGLYCVQVDVGILHDIKDHVVNTISTIMMGKTLKKTTKLWHLHYDHLPFFKYNFECLL